MSSALVRQALAFVDQEETKVRGKKRRVDTSHTHHSSIGQVSSQSHKQKSKKRNKASVLPDKNLAEENIKKFLALSTPTVDKAVVEKLIQRAVKGKPLTKRIEVKVVEDKSILFPEEGVKKTKRK